jgi:glutamate-1-semialdehyde 2,1-aminomutase
MAAGQGSLILGNSIPEVRAAVLAQAAKSYYVQTPWPEVIELAELLCARFPAAQKVRFVESGTKAANLAVRLGRAFSQKDKFAKFIGRYHGIWDGALVAPSTRYTQGSSFAGPLPGVARSAAEDVILLPWNEPDACRELIYAHACDIGTLIMEPMMGDGYLPPLPGFLQMIRDACDECDIVLVFDEAITQSLAPGGAQEYFGVVPDLTTLAKGAIGGGLPLAAVGGRTDIMALTDPLTDVQMVPSGSTFASHAMSVAAGLAQARLLTPAVYGRLSVLGDRVRNRLAELAQHLGCEELRATGVGNLIFLHWNAKEPTTYADHLQCDSHAVSGIISALLDEGYITAAGGRLHVSAAMTEDAIDEFVAAMERIIVKRITGAGGT